MDNQEDNPSNLCPKCKKEMKRYLMGKREGIWIAVKYVAIFFAVIFLIIFLLNL